MFTEYKMDALHQSWITFIFRGNTYNLRNFQIILNKNKKAVRYGSETISYRTILLRANLPEEYKLANSLSEFKSEIKT